MDFTLKWVLLYGVLPTLVYIAIGLYILSLEHIKKRPGYKLPALIYFISVPSLIVIIIILTFSMNYVSGRYESANKPTGYELYKFLVLKDIIPRSSQQLDEEKTTQTAKGTGTESTETIEKTEGKEIKISTVSNKDFNSKSLEEIKANLKVGDPIFSLYLGNFESGEKNVVAEIKKEKWGKKYLEIKGMENQTVHYITTKFIFSKDNDQRSISKTVYEKFPSHKLFTYKYYGTVQSKRINIPKEFGDEGGNTAFQYRDTAVADWFWYYYDTENLNIANAGASHQALIIESKINEKGEREFDGLCNEPNDWYKNRYNLSCKQLYEKKLPRIKSLADSFPDENYFNKFENHLIASLNNQKDKTYSTDEKYYALIIGNNNYEHLEKLDAAENDAKVLAKVLQDKYGFEVELLLNGDYDSTVNSLFAMTNKLKQNDNLLIYYAGHGELDKAENRGYWLPVDASYELRSKWISNTRIVDRIKATKAKHVLLMVDSCFSGTLMRSGTTPGVKETIDEKYIERLKKKKTRLVITSGGNEPVVDSDGGQHSLFALKLIDTLKNNNSVINSQILFENIRKYVAVNADQTPESGKLHKTGHDGGDFLFFPKN